jgi:hypothetical protein
VWLLLEKATFVQFIGPFRGTRGVRSLAVAVPVNVTTTPARGLRARRAADR